MKTLTASDRKALIRLAHSLPAGSEERKVILAGLANKTARDEPVDVFFNVIIPALAKAGYRGIKGFEMARDAVDAGFAQGREMMGIRASLKQAEWKGWDDKMPVQVATKDGTKVYDNLAAAKKKHPSLDPTKQGKEFTWAMKGRVKGKDAIRFEDWDTYKRNSQ